MAGDEVGEALTALEAHKQSMAGQTIASFAASRAGSSIFMSNSMASCSISRRTA